MASTASGSASKDMTRSRRGSVVSRKGSAIRAWIPPPITRTRRAPGAAHSRARRAEVAGVRTPAEVPRAVPSGGSTSSPKDGDTVPLAVARRTVSVRSTR